MISTSSRTIVFKQCVCDTHYAKPNSSIHECALLHISLFDYSRVLFACWEIRRQRERESEIPCKYGAYHRVFKTLYFLLFFVVVIIVMAVEKMFKLNWIHSHSCLYYYVLFTSIESCNSIFNSINLCNVCWNFNVFFSLSGLYALSFSLYLWF